MPRLFSGLKLPSSIAQWLIPLQSGLKDVRWIEAENLHITLRFLGDVDPLQAQEFSSQLDQIALKPFNLKLKGLGSFGGKKPRCIWVGVEKNETLLNLQKKHERAAILAGSEPERRNFMPHVTLLRPRNVKAGAVARYLQEKGQFESPSFEVSGFELFSARPETGGGPYLIEKHYPDQFNLKQCLALANIAD